MWRLSRNRASGIPPENNALEVVLVMSRRSKFEIMADILRLDQASQTRILHSSGISAVLLDRYLSLLTERGFLTITTKGNHRTYHTTGKGENLLQQIDNIYEQLRSTKAKISMALKSPQKGVARAR